VLALLGGLAQINPVWLYGPFSPSAVSTAAQPDWYLGWIEGALRIMPPVYLHLGPYNVSELFWPAIALPTITFGLLFLWPFLEQRMTHDHREHHVLDRPSERPVRTALGVVVLSFYAVLLLAGGQDIWAQQLDVSLSAVLWTFRVLVFVLPVVFGAFTYKFCRDLERHRHAARARPPPTADRAEQAAVDRRLPTGAGTGTGTGSAPRVSSTVRRTGSGSSSCSCCAAPARWARARAAPTGFTGPDHGVGALRWTTENSLHPARWPAWSAAEANSRPSTAWRAVRASPGSSARTRQGRASGTGWARGAPVLTDLPIGFWTSAFLSTCSADGTRAGRPPACAWACSQRCDVATGVSDWSDGWVEPARRLRAAANTTALLSTRVVGGAQTTAIARRRARTRGRVRSDGGRLPGRPPAGAPGSASTTPRSGTRHPSGRR
jgi:hypothetical protein